MTYSISIFFCRHQSGPLLICRCLFCKCQTDLNNGFHQKPNHFLLQKKRGSEIISSWVECKPWNTVTCENKRVLIWAFLCGEKKLDKSSIQFCHLHCPFLPNSPSVNKPLPPYKFVALLIYASKRTLVNVTVEQQGDEQNTCPHEIVRRPSLSKSAYVGSKNCNLGYRDLVSSPDIVLLGSKSQRFLKQNGNALYTLFTKNFWLVLVAES